MTSQPRPTPTPAEIAKGLGWLARNLPTIAAWITYLKKAVRDAKATGNLVLVIACAMSSGACSTTQVAAGVAAVGGILAGLGKLPDLPPPPGTATATPTPTPVSVTPTPPTSGTANPSATPTPTPSLPPVPPIPTEIPTAPVPPTPTPTHTPCNAAAAPTSHYIRPRAAPCRRGYIEEVGLCWAEPDTSQQPCRPCAEHAYLDIRGGHARIDEEGRYVENAADELRYWDAYCRKWREDGTLIGDWEYSGNCAPRTCEVRPGPTPAPPSGPTPPPPVPTGGVRDFVWSWTNVSDKCRNYKDGKCQPDGAHRFKCTLVPEDLFIQNTCDRDHWHCAIETCDRDPTKTEEEWAKVLQDHRHTYRMCGGDEWIVASGIRHEWRYVGENDQQWKVADKLENPYQAEFFAGEGAWVETRGCLDAGAHSCPDWARGKDRFDEFNCAPQHRRPVPGGSGCSQIKKYEVR